MPPPENQGARLGALEDVHSGELHGFADLDALLRYLKALDCAGHERGVIEERERDEGRSLEIQEK